MLLSLLISLIFCSIIGGIVAGITGISILFWVVSIFLFVVNLPFMLIGDFIDERIDYIQDREDYREIMRDLAEEDRFERHEYYEDERLDRYIESSSKKPTNLTFNDNRQVNIYDSSDEVNKKLAGRKKVNETINTADKSTYTGYNSAT